MSESTIIVERSERVGIIKLNRPRAYNALSGTLINELLDALRSFESDPSIGAIILTGNEKDSVVSSEIFLRRSILTPGLAAGADIKEQSELSFIGAYNQDYLKNLNDGFFAVHKPIIGVINGIALGGGCELAMMCDILYAAESATFGQPEITLGTIQELEDAALNQGYWKAMHMVLTGETISAKEAEAAGLVAKVLPTEQVFSAALNTAGKIASFSAPIVAMAKEAVNEAEELGLKNGLHFESRLYHATFDWKIMQKAFKHSSPDPSA